MLIYFIADSIFPGYMPTAEGTILKMNYTCGCHFVLTPEGTFSNVFHMNGAPGVVKFSDPDCALLVLLAHTVIPPAGQDSICRAVYSLDLCDWKYGH